MADIARDRRDRTGSPGPHGIAENTRIVYPLFGTVQAMVNPKTTPFGAFIGSAAGFRIIQLGTGALFCVKMFWATSEVNHVAAAAGRFSPRHSSTPAATNHAA
jgi:hypothetical protein